MKTYKNLYPQIYNFGNLYAAYRKARKGKRGRVAVAAFEFDMEHNLLQLQAELYDQTYRPGPYHNFYIYEPKLRLVSAAPFRDRVVHHALCQVIEPIWEPRFISTSFACRVGKGTHKALDQCRAWVRQYRCLLYTSPSPRDVEESRSQGIARSPSWYADLPIHSEQGDQCARRRSPDPRPASKCVR